MNINKIMIAVLLSFNISIFGMESDNNVKFEKTMPIELIVQIVDKVHKSKIDSFIKSVNDPKLRTSFEFAIKEDEDLDLFKVAQAFRNDKALLTICKLLNVDLSKIHNLDWVKIENKDKPITAEGEPLFSLLPFQITVDEMEKTLKTLKVAWFCKILSIPMLPKELNEQQLKEHIDSLSKLFS